MDFYNLVIDILNRASSNTKQNIPIDKFFNIANIAQSNYLKSLLRFDEIDKVAQAELQNLVVNYENVASKDKESYFITIPSNYYFYKTIEAVWENSCNKKISVYSTPIETGSIISYNEGVSDLDWEDCYFTIEGDSIIIRSTQKINSISLKYYKKPKLIDKDTTLEFLEFDFIGIFMNVAKLLGVSIEQMQVVNYLSQIK